MIIADIGGLTSVGTIVAIVIGLVTLVLGAINVRNKYASSQDAQTITSLQKSNAAYKTQSETDQLSLDGKQRENELLAQKAEILEKHVTQAPQINDLAVQLATQHKELMEAFTIQSSNIGQMAKELGNVAKAVVKSTQDV